MHPAGSVLSTVIHGYTAKSFCLLQGLLVDHRASVSSLKVLCLLPFPGGYLLREKEMELSLVMKSTVSCPVPWKAAPQKVSL